MIPATPTAVTERYGLTVDTTVYLPSEAVRLLNVSLIFASNGKKKKKKGGVLIKDRFVPYKKISK